MRLDGIAIAFLFAGVHLASCELQTVPPKVAPCTQATCPEWSVCTRWGCEWLGDPNGPGPADANHEGSDPSQTPTR